MRPLWPFHIVFGICVATCVYAAPSVISLDSGEQLIGEVLPQSTAETVFVNSSVLGEVQLPRARVTSIEPKVAATVVATLAPEPKPVVAKIAAVPDLEPKSAPAPASKPEPAMDPVVAQLEEPDIVETLRTFKAPEDWSGNLRLGINISDGDRKWTETFARGKLEIKPKKTPNFYRFTGAYTYRETERSSGDRYKSTDKYDLEFIYRRSFLNNDFFVQNAMGGRVDQIKGIDRELQESVGIGYHFKPSSEFHFLFGGGGGIEDFRADFEDNREGVRPLLNVFQEANWRPLPRTSVVQKFNYYWNPEEEVQYNYVLSTAIRVRLTDLLGFEVSYSKSYDNDLGNGNQKNDSQWRNALVVYF